MPEEFTHDVFLSHSSKIIFLWLDLATGEGCKRPWLSIMEMDESVNAKTE